MGLVWFLYGILAFVSILGIPWGRSCFMLANFSVFPFGRTIINRKLLNQKDDLGTGLLGFFGNIIWLIFGGWVLALGHLSLGLMFCITIIGIPFGFQHFKLAVASLLPVGNAVVSNELAQAVYNNEASTELFNRRNR